MPATVRVIHWGDFIRARPDGDADIERAEQLLKDIAQAGNGMQDFDILVDTRKVTGRLSVADLWSLAEKLARFRQTFSRRTAILCPEERFDHVRFFALCAENRGFNVQAFASYEAAMEWLLSGSQASN